MNAPHFHLIVNHLPIVFPLVGMIVLLAGFYTKSEIVKRTSFFIFILSALAALVAMWSGEGAEEVVENITGVDERFIEVHADAALNFAVASYLLGGLSLLALWSNWKQKPYARLLPGIVLTLSMITLLLAASAGTSGGEIRHNEIRNTGTAAAPIAPNAGEEDDD
jgi:uncharacterized membrane protein